MLSYAVAWQAQGSQSGEEAAAARTALARRLQQEAEEKDEREYQVSVFVLVYQ